MKKKSCISPFLLAATCVTAAVAAGPGDGPSLENWKQHVSSLVEAPGLVRLYALEPSKSGHPSLGNRAGRSAPLRSGFVGTRPNGGADLPLCAGRWPEKQALRLDRTYLTAEPFPIANSAFTVAAWVRVHGPGSIRGDSVPTGGTLFSTGSGYHDGWRITLRYPERAVGFEIGRPPHSTGIRGGLLCEGAWHLVAATWDGSTMRLFVDGLPVAEGEYAGQYTPPRGGGRFRLGFAGAGWGSLRMDVDEVALFDRAAAPGEMLRLAHFATAVAEDTARRFDAAAEALKAGDATTAEEALRPAADSKEAPPAIRAAARLLLARTRLEDRNRAGAAQALSAILEQSGPTASQRRLAVESLVRLLPDAGPVLSPRVMDQLLASAATEKQDRPALQMQLARTLRQTGDLAAARDLYEKLLQSPELSPRQRLDVRLEMGHAALAAEDCRAARASFSEVVASKDAPGHYKSAAQLRIATTYVRERNDAAAREAYTRLANMPGVPEHHRWEAEQCARELERTSQGLPPRDPAATRTEIAKLPQPGLMLYMAPGGDDGDEGTQARPLATLEAARDRIRQVKKQGGLPAGGVTVMLRGGEYRRTQPLALSAEDSGTAEAPLVYRAMPGETPRLYGGVRIERLAPATDQEILARLPEAARGKVVQADLRAAGIEDLGKLAPRGYGRKPPPTLEVFYNDRPLEPARWPNQGFVEVAGVAPEDQKGSKGFTFEYQGDRPQRWKTAPDAWLRGYWYRLWADNYVPVAALDTDKRRITVGDRGAYGEVRAGAPYYVLNLLEELDAPGEMYLDRSSGILYFYPPEAPGDKRSPEDTLLEVSMLAEPFVQMEEVSHVRLEHVTMELGRADGVTVRGGSNCLLAGCTIRKLAGTAVIVAGGARHGLFGCHLHTLGRGGSIVVGGDRRTLAPGGHFVENCHVHDFSRIDRTYTPAVRLEGVGGRIAHNHFHHSPCHAMRIEGNDHLVELNEVDHVVTESDDQGGVDMWGNPTYRGNVFRYNYWHHIASGGPCGQAGIRLDDAISGTLVYGNVFYRCSESKFGGVQIHGGKENILDNNLFVDCNYAVSFSSWGEKRWEQFLASDRVAGQLKAVTAGSPPYSTRYPGLARLHEAPDVNSVWRSLVVGCGGFLTRDRGIQDLRDNLIVSLRKQAAEGQEPADIRSLLPDPATLDAIGFRPIPLGEIGLYEHELRAGG